MEGSKWGFISLGRSAFIWVDELATWGRRDGPAGAKLERPWPLEETVAPPEIAWSSWAADTD